MAEKVKDIEATIKEMGVEGILGYQTQQGMIKAGGEYKDAAEKINSDAFKKKISGKYQGKANTSQIAAEFGREYLKNLGQDFSKKDDEAVHAELALAAGREYSSVIAALGHGDVEQAKTLLGRNSSYQHGATRKSVLNTTMRNNEGLLNDAVGYLSQAPPWKGHSKNIITANLDDYLEAAGSAHEAYQQVGPMKPAAVYAPGR